MRINIILYLFVGLFCMFTGSCKKETPAVPETTEETDTCYCAPLKPPGIEFGCPSCDTDFDETFYSCPVINPNNTNEFIYLDGIFPNSRVMFYNMETHEKRVLIDENVSGHFSWSRKDWILFQRTADFNLYKVKSNGDSLTQLTHGGNWFHGQWNYAGDKFIVYDKNSHLLRSFIMNEHSTVIDSLTNWEHTYGSWIHPLYYLGGSTFEIMIMNIENKTILKHLNFEKETNLLGWVSLNEILYRQQSKTYLYNIVTDETKLIKCECHKNLINSTFSSDFSKLLFIKVEDSLQTNNRIFEDSKLILMNKDGTGEQEIIP